MKKSSLEKKELHIEFQADGFALQGRLHLPGIKKPPLVIGSHGLEGSKDSAKQQVLSRLLVKNNMAYFRFDHRGCGESQGNFITDTSLETRTNDLTAAARHLLSLGKTSRNLALFGSSMGGATCINAWEKLLEMEACICGAVLCAAPVKSRSIQNIPTEANDHRPALPISFFEKNLLFDIRDKAGALSNLLIFHGDADEVVPLSNARDIFSKAKEPKEIVIHEGGDHQMTSPSDQVDFEARAVKWFSDCFSRSGQTAP